MDWLGTSETGFDPQKQRDLVQISSKNQCCEQEDTAIWHYKKGKSHNSLSGSLNPPVKGTM
jgi:hypothetical protein